MIKLHLVLLDIVEVLSTKLLIGVVLKLLMEVNLEVGLED